MAVPLEGDMFEECFSDDEVYDLFSLHALKSKGCSAQESASGTYNYNSLSCTKIGSARANFAE